MFKATLFCSALLMLSSVAVAQTQIVVDVTSPPDCPANFKLQHQSFGIGGGNLVTLVGAGGTAQNTNTATIFQNQYDQKICSVGTQQEVITFVQDGQICATCGGAWDVSQIAMIGGSQMQLIGDGCGSKLETQTLSVNLGNQVDKYDGSGAATGIHSLGSVQQQSAANSAGNMSQTNGVAVGQFSLVAGGPSTEAHVNSGLGVMTTQTNLDM